MDRLKTLIVDDHVSSAFITGQLFEALGSTVQIVHSARDALMMIEDMKPDLVMVDISMPDIDGYELCHRLRKLPIGQDMYIVAQSGWCDEDKMSKATDAGFDQYLLKPVEFDAIQSLLASFDRPASQSSG